MIQCSVCGRYAVKDYIPLSSGSYCSQKCVPGGLEFLTVDTPTPYGFLVIQKPEVKVHMNAHHEEEETSIIHHYIVDGQQLRNYRKKGQALKPLLKFKFRSEAPTAHEYSLVFTSLLPLTSSVPVRKFHYTDKEDFHEVIKNEEDKLYGFTKSYPDLTDLHNAMKENQDDILKHLLELVRIRTDRWAS